MTTETILDPAQAAPAANTEVVLYTVTAAKSLVSSTIVVACDGAGGGSSSSSYRIAVVKAADVGGATVTKQYIAKDTPMAGPGDVQSHTIGLTLLAGGVIRVWSNDGHISFNLFGTETG